MSVWYCIPSKRPPDQVDPVLAKWRERGYKTALWLDEVPKDSGTMKNQSLISYWISGGPNYPGYAQAVNALVTDVLETDPSCDWIVTGGDDILPDPNHTAEEIADSCTEHFGGPYALYGHKRPQNTFGVMQPTGDRWGDSPRSRKEFGEDRGAYIDRVCGSPWMGREFCQRIYGGKGPLWPEYRHMYVDQELFDVATKLGILWQRRDLIHEHQHWGRSATQQIPEFLKSVNTPEHFAEAKALYDRRAAFGFEPLLMARPIKSGGFAEATL